jgi:integrase
MQLWSSTLSREPKTSQRIWKQLAGECKLKTQYVIDAFFKNKRRHVRTTERYLQIFRSFSEKYPELPLTPFEINEWLSTINGSSSNLATHYAVIRALYKFGFEMLDIPDPFKKLHSPKVEHKERHIWTAEELTKILSSAKPGRDLILCLAFLDSTCRVGAFGKHETTPGNFYPGINISNLSNDSFTVSDEKTGERRYRCLPEILNLMRQIANKDGFIFTSRTGRVMTSKDLSKLVTRIVKAAGITGKKLGPHSFRHLGGSLIAKATRSALAVKAILGHDEIETSMKYIHDAENDIQQEISPLKLAGQSLERVRQQQQTAQQHLALTDGIQTTSTDLTLSETPIEHVEAQPDLTEELFPMVRDDIKAIRPALHSKDLILIRKVFIYYSKYAPINGDTAKLSGLMRNWLSKLK